MTIWEKPVSHGELLKRIWKNLDLGCIQRKHPFHTPAFVTVGDGFADPRTVILRRFWRRSPALAFHTHIGSPKVAQIGENPTASWLFYHPKEKFQLRIRGAAEVHSNDELADEQWRATSLFGKRCYIGEAPSQISKKPTHGMPTEIERREPTVKESETGRDSFCVITTSIDFIDCVELDVRGHRRSFFKWDDNGKIEMGWLTP